jgi:hypothetical protein
MPMRTSCGSGTSSRRNGAVSDHLREAGIIVAHLNRALLDGSRDLSTIPALIRRVIAENMWRQWVDPASGRKVPQRPFRSFHEFIATPSVKGGLGSTVRQLEALCKDDKEALSLLDAALQRPAHIHADVNNVNVRPVGNSESAALRRLRKDAPELHAEVLAERLTAHAAMLQAGFRPKTITIAVTRPDAVARSLRKHMSPSDLAALIAYLGDGNS